MENSAVIYFAANIEELVLKLRLQKDTDGNMVTLRLFWDFEYKNDKHTLPSILLYCDLFATCVERNIEAAGKIYER